jgi:hypothetical protein
MALLPLADGLSAGHHGRDHAGSSWIVFYQIFERILVVAPYTRGVVKWSFSVIVEKE